MSLVSGLEPLVPIGLSTVRKQENITFLILASRLPVENCRDEPSREGVCVLGDTVEQN